MNYEVLGETYSTRKEAHAALMSIDGMLPEVANKSLDLLEQQVLDMEAN